MTPLSFRESAWMQSIRLNPHTDSVWHGTVRRTIPAISPGIKVPDDPETSPEPCEVPFLTDVSSPSSRAIRLPVLAGLITGADVINTRSYMKDGGVHSKRLVLGSSMKGREFKTQRIWPLVVRTDHRCTSSAVRLSAVQISFQSDVVVSFSISKEVPLLSM